MWGTHTFKEEVGGARGKGLVLHKFHQGQTVPSRRLLGHFLGLAPMQINMEWFWNASLMRQPCSQHVPNVHLVCLLIWNALAHGNNPKE